MLPEDEVSSKPYHRVIVEDPAVGEPELRLWRSVMLQAINDALDPNERQEIIRWIPSADFGEVCGNAGLEPSKVGPLLAKIVLGKKPHSIVQANRLKMLVYYGMVEVV